MRSYSLDFRILIGRGHRIGNEHTGRWWPTGTWPDRNLLSRRWLP